MTVGDRVRRAIECEATARKAGNVHPDAHFDDMSFAHFLQAACVVGTAIDESIGGTIGGMVYSASRAMMEQVGCNTSLGTILLIAPLAKAAELNGPLKLQSVFDILQELTADDSRQIYDAIRLSKPGGLGQSESMDVQTEPPESILCAMHLAASWDDVALQYANGFEQVFEFATRLCEQVEFGRLLLDAVRCLQVDILASRVDSLIQRKLGADVARDVQERAVRVQRSGPYGSELYEAAWTKFDQFLRGDRHRRNPGTTADLIAAALFVHLGDSEPSRLQDNAS